MHIHKCVHDVKFRMSVSILNHVRVYVCFSVCTHVTSPTFLHTYGSVYDCPVVACRTLAWQRSLPPEL